MSLPRGPCPGESQQDAVRREVAARLRVIVEALSEEIPSHVPHAGRALHYAGCIARAVYDLDDLAAELERNP